ncbi:4'-phosphopantetheinyl transferase family protein [Acutalibacter caecimuris]|uniref:4'-phosphopantetheinyl transferase family protein n=1 Tax=Acutalibacter caecimuris TaxID=3093657 RepID=UPI002AC8A470|nr:4'-phosphopantetheinyl transferase superfamily protein [Acutalibacter sp. M00118]
MTGTAVYITSLPAGKARQEETGAGRALLALGLMRAGFLAEGAPGQVDINPLLVYGPRGKPAFQELPVQFSISHSHGLVACALGKGELGLDVERLRIFSPRLAARVARKEERCQAALAGDFDSGMTQLWTCKESYMKYTGLGMAQGLQAIPVAALGPQPRLEGQPGLHLNSIPLWRGGQRFWLTLCQSLPGSIVLEFIPRQLLGTG